MRLYLRCMNTRVCVCLPVCLCVYFCVCLLSASSLCLCEHVWQRAGECPCVWFCVMVFASVRSCVCALCLSVCMHVCLCMRVLVCLLGCVVLSAPCWFVYHGSVSANLSVASISIFNFYSV